MTSAHIIVFGNEKGGSGKSTAAMHAAIALARLGYKTGSIDLDARQGTLTRYMDNRRYFAEHTGNAIPCPLHRAVPQSELDDMEAKRAQEEAFLAAALAELRPLCQFIIIDTPGTDNYLSRLGHGHADTLVTPLNDSLLDLDLLARINPVSYNILGPSVYTQMVQEQKPAHWIVMRNRLSHMDARNKKIVGTLLEDMSGIFGFDLAPGFGERVIFRDLFLKGLTLLDLKEEDEPLTLSQIAARQEVRQLVRAIGPEKIKGYAKPPA